MNKEIIDVLPIGAVVVLKKYPDLKAMILGHGVVNGTEVKNYACCVYPNGAYFDHIGLMNHEEISHVLYPGYYDREQEKYMDDMDKTLDKSKGKFGRFTRFFR